MWSLAWSMYYHRVRRNSRTPNSKSNKTYPYTKPPTNAALHQYAQTHHPDIVLHRSKPFLCTRWRRKVEIVLLLVGTERPRP